MKTFSQSNAQTGVTVEVIVSFRIFTFKFPNKPEVWPEVGESGKEGGKLEEGGEGGKQICKERGFTWQST